MLTKKDIKRFNLRVSEYDNFTSEKEIETEFYNFIKQFYNRKYTEAGEGKINYTSPYNIDGLLEVRTLDTDYRILVEAKASKDYSNKRIRNEVLSQAIYYCRKLNHYGELLPAVILLIEAKSMVIIKTDDIKEYCEEVYNGNNASGAYLIDSELIERLNNTDYTYELIKFNNKTKYNKIFNRIDNLSVNSDYTIEKTRKFNNDLTFEIFNSYINTQNNFKYYKDNWYFYGENVWTKTTQGHIKSILQFFILNNNYQVRCVNMDELITLLKNYSFIEKSSNIAFNNVVINYKTNEVLEKDKNIFYSISIPFKYVVNFNYSNKYLNFDLLIDENKKIFIETCLKNYSNIVYICETLNRSVSEYNLYNGEDVIIYENKDTLKFNKSIDEVKISSLIIEELGDFNNISKILTAIANTSNNLNYQEVLEFSSKSLINWKNRGDNIKNWVLTYLEKDENSYVLLEDLRDSHNYYLTSLGFSELSYKNFLDRFTSNNIFQDLKLAINRGRVARYKQSKWIDPRRINDKQYIPRVAGGTPTHIKGYKFKDNI